MKRIPWLFSIAPLWACAVVEGDRLLAAHLAAQVPAFAALDAATDIGPAPLAGVRREFRGFEIERLARQHAIELSTLPFPAVCFERATQTLAADVLLPLLQEAIKDDVAIEIVEFNRNKLPLGKLEFSRSGLTSDGLWHGRLLFGENRSTPVWARVRVRDRRTGEPIAIWRSPAEPDVENGDTVRVEVTSGGVLLAFEARAESSGQVGEPVMIRNPENGKRFRAIVEGPGKVTIQK